MEVTKKLVLDKISENDIEIRRHFNLNDTLSVDFFYPRANDSGTKITKIKIGLVDVRAADDILIEYDFDRDGYVIKQATKFSWDEKDGICDPGWKEAAFVPAFQFEAAP